MTANRNVPWLVGWFVSPEYVPVIRSCLGAAPDGVYVTWHDAVAPVPPNVQGDPTIANEPAVALVVKATVPLGVMAVPGDVSCTFVVHVAEAVTATGDGVQTTVVVVLRCVTVIPAVPWLVSWVGSPLYVAVSV